jgi:hypothetical protein
MPRGNAVFTMVFFVACAVLVCSPVAALAQGPIPGTPSGLSVEPWEEAGRLFRSDPHWLGGDGASSVDLGAGRILWLFGDSLVDTAGTGLRSRACLVRNSVAVQTGKRPGDATMEFFWKVLGNRPRSFFREEGGKWFWPGSGVRIGDRLIVFW